MLMGEFAREIGGGIDLGGKDRGFAGLKQDVVERKTFGDRTINHWEPREEIETLVRPLKTYLSLGGAAET